MTAVRRTTICAAVMLAGLLIARVDAQDPDTPRFDIASMKPNRTGDVRAGFRTSPGRLSATNVTLRALIAFAYSLQDFQLVGSSNLLTERFDSAATMDVATTTERTRLMMRTLLADRFALRWHRETRELPLYTLTRERVDKLGPQLRATALDCEAPSAAAAAPEAMPCGYFGPVAGTPIASGRSSLAFRGLTMATFSRALGPPLGRMVVDRTGLDGRYDGELEFTTELAFPPPPPGVTETIDRSSLPSIFAVLPAQLGLELHPTRGPVDLLVVDSVSPLTPD